MDTKYIYILKSWIYKADQGTNFFSFNLFNFLQTSIGKKHR